MADESFHEQLLNQLSEQNEALEEIATMLAMDSTPELVQVEQTLQPTCHGQKLCSCAAV